MVHPRLAARMCERFTKQLQLDHRPHDAMGESNLLDIKRIARRKTLCTTMPEAVGSMTKNHECIGKDKVKAWTGVLGSENRVQRRDIAGIA